MSPIPYFCELQLINMINNLSPKKEILLNFLKNKEAVSSKEIHEGLEIDISYATVKRLLQELIAEQLVTTKGAGKSTKYNISSAYELLMPIDVEAYYQLEIDERIIKNRFNHALLTEIITKVNVFSLQEMNYLNQLQAIYKENIKTLLPTQYKLELERLAIDLSWKSAQIEGNTYSLLETERLLKEKQTASGKTKEEAIMLWNHKDALDFIISNPDYVNSLNVKVIEDIHSLLMKDLNVERNIRTRRIGITGTNYKPLENEFQIKEALERSCEIINQEKNVFVKAFWSLMLLSYIQAFNDGNKRTARIVSNAILINNNYCPISFRTVDAIEYKKAMLLFYEQNNISAFKKIFINQFEFAVHTYF